MHTRAHISLIQVPALLTSDGTLLTDDTAIRAALGGADTPLPPVVAQLDALTDSVVVPIITDYRGTGSPSCDVKPVLDAVEGAANNADIALAASVLPLLLTVRTLNHVVSRSCTVYATGGHQRNTGRLPNHHRQPAAIAAERACHRHPGLQGAVLW